MKKMFITLIILLLMAVQTVNLCGDDPKKEDLKVVTVKVHYLDVFDAHAALRNYASRTDNIRPVKKSSSLIIHDHPKIVEKLLKILKEIDVKPQDIQFTIDLVEASRIPPKKGQKNELKDDPVIKELGELLKFKSFRLLSSTIMKVQDDRDFSNRVYKNLEVRIAPNITRGDEIMTYLMLRKHHPDKKEDSNTTKLLGTKLSLKNNERTVVGVSKLNGDEHSLILIIAAKIIK